MTLFPIVERELRVAARRRETYWTRLAIAIVAMLIAAGIFVVTIGLPSTQTGRYIFGVLAGLQLLYCLVYGRRATADSISHEKREGTLGLLFLTDLKGHDIVLGKLAATSLRGFYGLLAVFPVLAVPLLLGGLTNGEFWRLVLVLVNTFFFSLAIGIFGSSLSRDFRHAMGANLFLLLLLAAIPPAVAVTMAMVSGKAPIPQLFFTCPAYSFYLCADAQYKTQAANFWCSLGATHFLTWLLVMLASVVVPRSWHDQPARERKNRWREFWRAWSYGAAAKQSVFRRRLLNINAFYWLAARVRRKPDHVWAFLVCMGIWWLAGWAKSGTVWFDSAVAVLTALMLNGALKTWIAIEAGHQLAEDKKSGAFELLLTSPLTVQDILRGQFLALRRQFALPFVVVIAVELLFMRELAAHPGDHSVPIWLAGMVMLGADMVALSWVGMSRALTARSHNHATFNTLLCILVLPWMAFGLVVAAAHVYQDLVLEREWAPTWKFYLPLWFGLGLIADLVFGLLAWWRLRTQFHQLALDKLNPPTFASRPNNLPREKVAPHFTHQTPAPSHQETTVVGKKDPLRRKRSRRFLKPAIAIVGVLIIALCLYHFKNPQTSPPAILIGIGPSKGPTRVFPLYGGAVFILPDGAMWRWGITSVPGSGPASVPEQVGTNRDWIQAAAGGNHFLALRANGTIWEWGLFNGKRSSIPEQVHQDTNWVDIAASNAHSTALRRDGTIWAWGRNGFCQLGNGPGPDQTDFVQVGTNNDWTAIACPATSTFGLRKDGTLWTWGTVHLFKPGSMVVATTFPKPAQVALETNWAGFASGFGCLIRSRSGEIWEPFQAPPSADAPVNTSCRLVASNTLPQGIAVAVCETPKLYQLRSGGTLWEKPYAFSRMPSATAATWKQTGKRSDWVSLWSASGTAFGLTSDGTIWTWGYDSTRPPQRSSSWLKMIQESVRNRLGAPGAGGMLSYNQPAYQKEPRPLIRMIKQETNGPKNQGTFK